MVKKPAVLWLLPAGATAGWAETRGARGLCRASLAWDQKHAFGPIHSSGSQHRMAWQTRSFISLYKPSTTPSAVMLIWHCSLIVPLLLCWMDSSLPPLPSPQSHPCPSSYHLVSKYEKHPFGVSILLGIISTQTEAFNKSMHCRGYICKWWGKPSGGAVLSADISGQRDIICKLFWTSINPSFKSPVWLNNDSWLIPILPVNTHPLLYIRIIAKAQQKTMKRGRNEH